MKKFLTFTCVFVAAGAITAQADLLYDFSSGLDGFQNVTLTNGPAGWAGAPSAMQKHTAGGWQLPLTKEFAWGAGGGSENQQLEMQALANQGANAHISFDVMIDGASFPAGVATWFNFNVACNSDGAAGWTQRENLFTISGWHNADDPTLFSMHIDQPFSYFGWDPGDSWFQIYAGANSDSAAPVNFYLDNVKLYVVPEPATAALLGLGALALLIRRRS